MAILSNGIRSSTDTPTSSSSVSQSRSFRSGNSTITLHEGQTLKGVVSNVHGNEITLAMDDGTSFTGKLPNASQYSIGQKAAFLITTLDHNTIYMKAMSDYYLLDMDDTIDQALEEAALPKSQRNMEVVRSLLKNQQSISRENILASIRTCAKFPQANVDSVITMQRLHLPLTQTYVEQFEQYQQQEHKLLNQMNTLTDSLSDMMNAIGTQVPRFSKETLTQFVDLALASQVTPEEQALAKEQASAPPVLQAEDMENAENTPISPGEDTIEETAAESHSPLAKMRQLLTSLTDGVSTTNAALVKQELLGGEHPFIHEQTGFTLPDTMREEFVAMLDEYPLEDTVKQSLLDGSITAREFLTNLRKTFSDMTEEHASRLLTSKPFQALIKGQFLSNWTISPKHLKDTGAMEDLYQQMSKQFEQISHMSENLLGKDVFTQVSQQANQMNDNLDFMKLLNNTFQYIQLPIKMQNQNAHGDLYVMTQKEAMRKDPSKLKVLLHLDMDNLGTLDIHIARDGNAVTTKFFVDNEVTHRLLERNIELLQDAINEQGYSFTSELSMKEQEMDIVNDFIGADAPVGSITRYNFDLRA